MKTQKIVNINKVKCPFCGNETTIKNGRYNSPEIRRECSDCRFTFMTWEMNDEEVEYRIAHKKKSSGSEKDKLSYVNYERIREVLKSKYSEEATQKTINKAVNFVKKYKAIHKSNTSATINSLISGFESNINKQK
ncbi:MAG: hypothetical protein KIT33_10460 [Candidatus Kapabacteria bacterium]|nr:hypothetical protein [Ignavibacteriota bacterium]MCW5885381.1 hypothetical protein [Candidatus Kapabacteria bacterium]